MSFSTYEIDAYRQEFPMLDISSQPLMSTIGKYTIVIHPELVPHMDLVIKAYSAVNHLYRINKRKEILLFIGKCLSREVMGLCESMFRDDGQTSPYYVEAINLGNELFNKNNVETLRATLYHELCHAFYNPLVLGDVGMTASIKNGNLVTPDENFNPVRIGSRDIETYNDLKMPIYSFKEYLNWFVIYALQHTEKVVIDCMNYNWFNDKRTDTQALFVSHDILNAYASALRIVVDDNNKRLFKDRDIERKIREVMLTYAHPKDFAYIKQSLLANYKFKI
jgi:hypothetical protein